MKRLFLILALALPLLARGADAPPPVPGMEPLFDNGRCFSLPASRLPLRCFDAPALLDLSDADRGQLLDKAAAAGFNSISFEAPLFGPRGLSKTLGKVDEPSRAALGRVLDDLGLRRLYAFPVLYPPSAVDGLIGTGTARANFFAGKNALGWQAWALREAARLNVRGRPLTATAVVGGWILYRGPWPGALPMAGSASTTAQAQDVARQRSWISWQVKLARRYGFRQELGLGYWPKADLAGPSAQATPEPALTGPAPIAALGEVSFSPEALKQESKSLDVLPPVPGADAERVDDSGQVPAAPASPWDLEGVDWAQVDALFRSLPMASQLDFLELSLDTEDWYRVGERLAEAASKAEVPVIWRQDWRSASRYERGKRLGAPLPLAGLSGPWPEDDWPADGEALWPVKASLDPETAPFRLRSLKLAKEDGAVQLKLVLTRPGTLKVLYGQGLPLDKSAVSDEKDQAEHELALEGLKPGAWFLMKVEAQSKRFGECLLRTRWMKAPQ